MKILTLLFTMLALAACQSSGRSSAPSLFKDGILLKQKSVVVDADHAKVIMKPTGYIYPVQFSVRRDGDPDQRPESLGTAAYTGRGKVFGWIAKMNEVTHSAALKHFPQLELQADPDRAMEISGGYDVSDNNVRRMCGPLRSVFTPEKQKVYLVEFVVRVDGCEQHVYDITQPEQRIPVPTSDQFVRPS
ncbi:hypothetical protein AUC61_00480 [Pseudomonas sp. S25]|uniref:Lipoprotein n=1 Tax=Pseudomonas maioricensis TaxID=1766623 RepID=A0ABS9ZCY0_9PSED|nr:hypothetical protein [Pseudomonas sp. S25]MCI8207997.1 hypothetical protein [Pseudomonas sp. S25]